MRVVSLIFYVFFGLTLTSCVYSNSLKDTGYKGKHGPEEIMCLLTDGEEVAWWGRPAMKPLILQLVVAMSVTPVVGMLLYKFLPTSMSRDERWVVLGFGVCVPLGWGVFSIVSLVDALYAVYAVTNKGVFLNSGFLNSSIKFIKFSDIKGVEAHKGLVEGLFFKGIGSIYIDTGEVERYDVVQKNESVKKVKKRYGSRMIEDEIHETTGPDIIREKSRKKYYIFSRVSDYTKPFSIINTAVEKAGKKSHEVK